MEEINQNTNLNYSNKNTDDIIYKIQNSLDRLQTAINNKQILDDINDKTNIKNTNLTLRKKTFENKIIQRKGNPLLTEGNNSNILNNNNYSMLNNNSLFNNDKRFIERKINQNRLLNQKNYFKRINKTTEYINPKSTHGKNIRYNNITNRIKCIKCGNINPPKSKFCFNCGEPLNNLEKKPTYSSINNEININNSYFNKNIGNIKDNISQSQVQTKSYNNMNINLSKQMLHNDNNISSSKNIKIINNIYEDLKNIQNEDLINYKKLNDLYLYGDYLEKELKASNDENVKLLEKYKAIKSQVHSLNQKKNKLKQNIDILTKKEKELDRINLELKNGFDFVEKKLGINDNNNNNQEKIQLLKDLESNNKKYAEINNEYDLEIENLKKKISLLVDNDDDKENDEDENMIKNLENNNEKDKKELEEKNMLHMLLIKKNELLTLEITNLTKDIDLDLYENNDEEEENAEEEEKEKGKNKNIPNNEKKQESNDKKVKREILENKDEIKDNNHNIEKYRDINNIKKGENANKEEKKDINN